MCNLTKDHFQKLRSCGNWILNDHLNTFRYAIVEFLGYGNQETTWMNDIMESNGDKPRQLQIAESQGTTPPVDTVDSSATPAIEWKDRDACRVAVGSDGAEYEGTIKVALL